MRTAILVAAAILAGASAAQADPAAPHMSCIMAGQLENWKATPDAKTIYLRAQGQRYYRLDLTTACHALNSPGAFIVTQLRGPSSYCSAIDWDLHVSRSWGDIPEACIVKTMTQLTADDVKAIPSGAKP